MSFDIFGIGFDRIILILIVAMIVFGPDKLPVMARQAGKWVNELRRLTQDARGEIQSLTKEIDLEEFNKVKADLAGIRKELTDAGKDLLNNVQDVKKEISLTDVSGNVVAQQREQYTYEVKENPVSATDPTPDPHSYIVEETIKRETIIQDLVNQNEPVGGTETITATNNGHLPEEPESIIAPATPVVSVNAMAEATPSPVEVPYIYPSFDSSLYLSTGADTNGNGNHHENGHASSGLERDMLALEAKMQTTRQEMNERIEALERTFIERLDRLEQSLGQRYEEAGQRQGGL